jgi:hypothetical protein
MTSFLASTPTPGSVVTVVDVVELLAVLVVDELEVVLEPPTVVDVADVLVLDDVVDEVLDVVLLLDDVLDVDDVEVVVVMPPGSQASPIPFVSPSSCPGLTVAGQLSSPSSTVSKSRSMPRRVPEPGGTQV